MGVELVQPQHDALGLRVMHVDQVLDAVREVDPRALVADPNLPAAAQRFADQEEVDDALPLVRRIVPEQVGSSTKITG